jgi:hypothetical protein
MHGYSNEPASKSIEHGSARRLSFGLSLRWLKAVEDGPGTQRGP